MTDTSESKTSYNWKIHTLFARQDYEKCLQVIDRVLEGQKTGHAHFAMFTKAMILRRQGQINGSLSALEEAIKLDPQNPRNLKEIARSLYLLGKHKIALDVYDEALKKHPHDWELYHDKGLCHVYLKNLPEARSMFEQSIATEPHEVSYQKLGNLLVMQEDIPAALHTYMCALELTPKNSDTLTQIGLLHLRQGDSEAATKALEKATALYPQHPKAVLALGSILQDRLDLENALIKYRSATDVNAHSPQVWNNVGLCYFAKQRFIAAIACLKHALYLGPFEWIVCYNLGLVHINTQQYASAFNYLSAAINLKPNFAHSYMYLGVTLARLGDHENAVHAYERAVEKEPGDFLFRLNFAITLYDSGRKAEAVEQLSKFQDIYDQMGEVEKNADPEVSDQATLLLNLLKQTL